MRFILYVLIPVAAATGIWTATSSVSDRSLIEEAMQEMCALLQDPFAEANGVEYAVGQKLGDDIAAAAAVRVSNGGCYR
jgi:hypothetical protein